MSLLLCEIHSNLVSSLTSLVLQCRNFRVNSVSLSGVMGGTSGDCLGGKAVITGTKILICEGWVFLPGSIN